MVNGLAAPWRSKLRLGTAVGSPLQREEDVLNPVDGGCCAWGGAWAEKSLGTGILCHFFPIKKYFPFKRVWSLCA